MTVFCPISQYCLYSFTSLFFESSDLIIDSQNSVDLLSKNYVSFWYDEDLILPKQKRIFHSKITSLNLF